MLNPLLTTPISKEAPDSDRLSAPSSRPAVASPSIISRLILEEWKNGCKIVGPRNAKLAVVHYHGCLGLSVNEWMLIEYIRKIEKAGGPAIAIILPQSHRIVSSTLQGRKKQLIHLIDVIEAFTDEQKRHLPNNLLTSSIRDMAGGAYKVYVQGSQQWHDIVFTNKNGVVVPDLPATAPLLVKAGEEVTGHAAETRRSLGIKCFISSGFSMGVGMAAYEALLRDGDEPLGVLLAGAPLLREVCDLRPVKNKEIIGFLTIGRDDPIPIHALGHSVDDVKEIRARQGLRNIHIHDHPGGHYLDPEISARNLASILNAYLKAGSLACI